MCIFLKQNHTVQKLNVLFKLSHKTIRIQDNKIRRTTFYLTNTFFTIYFTWTYKTNTEQWQNQRGGLGSRPPYPL